MKYGKLPHVVGKFKVDCQEMMFYQYLLINLKGSSIVKAESRLDCFEPILIAATEDYKRYFGLQELKDSYIYLTAKHLWQTAGSSFNRLGYHSDGFMTDDVNYIWSDSLPTIFNTSEFNLTMDDDVSMKEMEEQALRENEVTHESNTLIRLDQYSIHKVQPPKENAMRTFVKVSISKDKYNLKGNSINPLLDYNWEMRDRNEKRNIPQNLEL